MTCPPNAQTTANAQITELQKQIGDILTENERAIEVAKNEEVMTAQRYAAQLAEYESAGATVRAVRARTESIFDSLTLELQGQPEILAVVKKLSEQYG